MRMYTSQNTGLTLLLISQVRMQGIGGVSPFEGMTGGNAIKFYNQNCIKMSKSVSLSKWPYTVSKLPENSFVVTYRIDKIKCDGRYKGLTLPSYFINGEFDQRFNIICLAKHVGIHDGKLFKYPDPNNPEEMLEYKAQGLNSMINGKNPIPDEAVKYMKGLILPAYNRLVSGDQAEKEELPPEEEVAPTEE